MKKIICGALIMGNIFFAFTQQKVDYDLTAMSPIMAYSMVFEIFMNPDAYVGKTIKVDGFFYRGYSDFTGNYFNCVLVGDDTGCCFQGLEFLYTDVENIAGNYPSEYSFVEITGVLDSYDVRGQRMYYVALDRS